MLKQNNQHKFSRTEVRDVVVDDDDDHDDGDDDDDDV